jgi:hypothetical protein
MGPSKLRGFIEAAFEGLELLGVLDAALPKHLRCKGDIIRLNDAGTGYKRKACTGLQKFLNLYDNVDQLDSCKLIAGLLNNAIEDKLIGLLGKAQAAVAIEQGKAYGLSGTSKKLGLPMNIPKFKCNKL